MKACDEHEGSTRKAWLLMLEQGGRWTVGELAQKLGLDRDWADRMTYFMVQNNIATKYRSPYRKNGVCYGVTKDNAVPRGLKLQDVLTATGIRTWELK
jgi:DNA-binding MarR family transcriptional regulator